MPAIESDPTASGAALQANGAGIDGFLAERSEALALEGHLAPADLAAHEELLEAIVDAARQAHALEDLAALVLRQRRVDGRAPQESVARLHELRARLLEAFRRGGARRRFGNAVRRRDLVVEGFCERAAERRPRGIELHRIATLEGAQPGRLERVDRVWQCKGMALGDERREAAGESGEL